MRPLLPDDVLVSNALAQHSSSHSLFLFPLLLIHFLEGGAVEARGRAEMGAPHQSAA